MIAAPPSTKAHALPVDVSSTAGRLGFGDAYRGSADVTCFTRV